MLSAIYGSPLARTLTIEGKENEKLLVNYPAIKTGTGYSAASILFGFANLVLAGRRFTVTETRSAS